MNLNKNKVSYFAWLVLVFFTGATYAFFGLILSQSSNLNGILVAGGIVTLFVVIVLGLYLLIGYFLKYHEDKVNFLQILELSGKLEWIFIVSNLVLGIFVRILMLEHAGEEAAYFDVCKVTDVAGISIKPVQGSVYIYCILLHGLFYFTGNNWLAGIWLQIILQIMGAFVICMGLKKLINKIPSYLVFCFILFSPVSIKCGITYSPQILYFCVFSIVFYFVSDYIKRSLYSEINKIFMWLYAAFCGMLIGLCIYMDISGVLVLFLWGIVPMIKRSEYSTVWIKRMIAGIAVAIVFLTLILAIDAVVSNSSIMNILGAWSILYNASGFGFEVLINKLSTDFIIMVILACVGCFSFWRRINTERFTPFILMAIGMVVLLFSGMTTENMSGTYLLYVLFTMLASVSITELFCADDIVKIRIEKNEEKKEVEFDEIKQIEYIENPLPVPKKHVRKTMDYAFIPDESQMKYDIYVSDNDDYDLKV